MHKGNNQGEDRRPVAPEEIKIDNSTKILEEIQSIRSSVETIKTRIREDMTEESKTGKAITQPTEETGKTADPAEVTYGANRPEVRTLEAPSHGEAAVGISAPKVPVPEGPAPVTDKVIKTIVEEERNVPKGNSETSDFAAKYKDHMMRQVSKSDEKKRAQEEKIQKRETARKEKEQLRAQRAELKAERKRRKKEEDEARKRERRARAKELQKKREIHAEVRRKKKIAARTAKHGGGVVQFHGTEISTEVQPVAKYSLKELLGFAHREKIKVAETEEEKKILQREQQIIAEDARQAAARLSQVRTTRYQNSAFGRRMKSIKGQIDTHKKLLLSLVGLIMLVAIGTTAVFNYYVLNHYTLYEYSYNGHPLGYVKSEDDVYRITDLVQSALTTDKDMEVLIEDEDITCRKVSVLDDENEKEIVPDTSDQVLKRLTYMGDINVKACGLYVNGDKVGSVRKKSDVADVLKKLEDRYYSGRDGARIEKTEIPEQIEWEEDEKTNLSRVYSVDKMTDKLCESENREIMHTVAANETLKDIANEYQVSEEDLLLDNEGIDPKKLVAGDTLLIKKTAPPVTVRITEKRSYDQKIKYETEERKTDQMYEGETEIKQEGKNGREHIVERSVSINGQIDEENVTVLDRKIKRKAVKKIIIVGTAERPPSVGDGVYIWPMEGGYTLTSRFGRRWGRLHAGIDLATGVGNDVLAADGGIVTRAGYFGGYGLCVDVDHQNGQSTRYGHLSQTLVSPGDEVYEGMHIAESGNTGFSTGAHLHFEIHVNGSPTDPLNYLP